MFIYLYLLLFIYCTYVQIWLFMDITSISSFEITSSSSIIDRISFILNEIDLLRGILSPIQLKELRSDVLCIFNGHFVDDYPQYRIKTDEHNIILVEIRKICKGDNIGKLVESNIGYYSSFKGLLRSVHDKMLCVHGLDDLVLVMNHVDSVVNSALIKFQSCSIESQDVVVS